MIRNLNRKIRILSSTTTLLMMLLFLLFVSIQQRHDQYSYYCDAFSVNNHTPPRITTTVFNNQQQRFGWRSSKFSRNSIHQSVTVTTTTASSTNKLPISRNQNRLYHHLSTSTTTSLRSTNDPDSNDESEDNEAPSKNEKSGGGIFDFVKWGIFYIWSYSFTVLGIGLSAGLVLNLFGYGYTFSKDQGLQIDSLDKLRTENQFRKVDKIYQQQYLKEQQSESQPPSNLPR